jgi:hypothetical protein
MEFLVERYGKNLLDIANTDQISVRQLIVEQKAQRYFAEYLHEETVTRPTP